MKLLTKALWILIGCLVLSVGTSEILRAQTGFSGPPYFRVMTFNIRYDEPRDNENAWPNRKELVANTIRFHQADLVGVQEALKRQLTDLERLLPQYDWVGVGRDDGIDKGEFSAILYRKNRFVLLETSTFWLSETPEVPGSKGWDSAYPRVVTWARFRDRTTGKIFFHFNTHFDHSGVRSREESARLLRREIDKVAGARPVVVTGDFNFKESSDGYQILTGKRVEDGTDPETALRDARYLSRHGHHGPTSTFNEFKALVTEMKIDFVLAKGGVDVLQHGVILDTCEGRFSSDHLPVLAEIVLR
ncbi:MAG TPA: endonuclease/exonuclease/phosphatase family protein [Pyrinomonadaceae bacterium]|nr:endonuclease/exonuclease/phosphatase family protein [Pyrinomonadaceae bacterium]